MQEIPSHHSSVALSQVFPPNNINFPNGQSYLGINARRGCITLPNSNPALDGIHCKGWTREEADFAVRVMRWFILVLFRMQIPILFMCCGGTGACAPFFSELKSTMMMMYQGATEEEQRLYRRLVCVIEGGTHLSNWVCWRYQYMTTIDQVCLMYLHKFFIHFTTHSCISYYPRLYKSAIA